ncbi:hypothetical protein AH67_02225 [Bifidobacterium pseudolongum PV8-2]|uniref:Uncharacterized protein n=1 Tax=Bifidobacterium pseudolongum PV8-2 TaxID=1447715 RepID=A0A0A7I9U5_9BIFI|nr:hypothetical protein [Bifidobacterium pseudolongum]AIZ17007.1 hypothetical protein AH67_02225 [Bifidobacterium pseudolongum PV8-2]
MVNWLTTPQVLERVDLAVTQQAIKKAAKREYARCVAAGTVSAYVRKNAAGRWEIRDDWELFRSWRRRGADRVEQVRERQSKEEELARLRSLCAEQARRIEELEAALAELRDTESAAPHETEGGGEEPSEGTLSVGNAQADDSEGVKGTVPSDIFTDDAALLRYWLEQGKPSRRAFGEQIGMSKSWASDHLKQAQQQREHAPTV